MDRMQRLSRFTRRVQRCAATGHRSGKRCRMTKVHQVTRILHSAAAGPRPRSDLVGQGRGCPPGSGALANGTMINGDPKPRAPPPGASRPSGMTDTCARYVKLACDYRPCSLSTYNSGCQLIGCMPNWHHQTCHEIRMAPTEAETRRKAQAATSANRDFVLDLKVGDCNQG